jgi:hypothetical protein
MGLRFSPEHGSAGGSLHTNQSNSLYVATPVGFSGGCFDDVSIRPDGIIIMYLMAIKIPSISSIY